MGEGMPVHVTPDQGEVVLAGQVLVGEQVLQSARLVGDEQDLAVWELNRQSWITTTAATLEDVMPHAVDDFRITCHGTVRGHWRAVFAAEQRATEEGLRLISSLLGTFGPGS